MGICMKTINIENADPARIQQMTNSSNGANSYDNSRPNNQINFSANSSVAQVSSARNRPHSEIPHEQNQNLNEFPLYPMEEVDMIEPDPQDLFWEGESDKQQNENEEDLIVDIEKLQLLKKASTSGIRQSNRDDSCGICYEKFHILKKWPLVICHNQHTICESCVKDFQKLFHKEPFPCPFCRLLVFDHEVKPSKKIFKTLSKLQYKSDEQNQQLNFYLYAFEHQLYEIALAFKQNRRKDLKKIEHLEFENKLIQSFPYFNNFKNIVYLQLQHNNIHRCQCLIPLSGALKILNLSHNHIEQLDWITEFSCLQILASEYNKIKQISFCNTILLLKELYLLGNKINDAQTVRNFQKLQFKNLQILSIESQTRQVEKFYLSQLDSQSQQRQPIGNVNEESKEANPPLESNILDKNLLQLKALIITNQQNNQRNVKIIPRASINNSLLNFAKEEHIVAHLYDSYFYGNLFQFKPDGKNSHYREYRLSENKLLKLSSNFTTINSKLWIPHVGKQTLKLKLREKNNNIMIGICTRDIKYSASIYCNQFIGITFWGNIYDKSQSIPIDCDLRLEDGSIIAMILNFDKGEISWYIDKRKIGHLTNQKQFLRTKELYFLLGVRDSNIEVEFII